MADAEQTVEDAVDPQQELVDETAARLTEIANQSLDSNEVARQIEELTSVVLDSAEVSTRSASIAADVSTTSINEQTLSFIPKVVCMGITMAIAGSWMINTMVDYTKGIFTRIPNLFM